MCNDNKPLYQDRNVRPRLTLSRAVLILRRYGGNARRQCGGGVCESFLTKRVVLVPDRRVGIGQSRVGQGVVGRGDCGHCPGGGFAVDGVTAVTVFVNRMGCRRGGVGHSRVG